MTEIDWTPNIIKKYHGLNLDTFKNETKNKNKKNKTKNKDAPTKNSMNYCPYLQTHNTQT